MIEQRVLVYGMVVLASCGDSSSGDGAMPTGVTLTAATLSTTDATAGTADDTSTSGPTSTGDDDGIKFDMLIPDTMPPVDACAPVELDRVSECSDEAPPDSFDPEVEWEWTPATPDVYSGVSPLVANLTDDNGDGSIDLCDVPDVVLVAGVSTGPPGAQGHIYVLDGETGTLHFQIPDVVAGNFTPALGDIDGDGLVEIVTLTPGGAFQAFEHDGTELWTWTDGVIGTRSSVAIANIDNAGAPEILAAQYVVDASGATVFTAADGWSWSYSTTTAADLDGDQDLEVILARAAYHHDGSQYYLVPGMPQAGLPAVGDVDDDGQPEIIVTNELGFTILEHDGTIQPGNQDLRPTGDPADHVNAWRRPVAIHDFDGDGGAEFALSSRAHYSVFEVAPIGILWTADVQDDSGIAGGTAFDFLGDGYADAMYGDEVSLFVFDGLGAPLLQVPHGSATYIEYPTVADIDNDGSAEILVVSNEYGGGGYPTLQAIRDVDDRWIQARRIWNQHTYHVSNVREDGVIPQFEPPHWALLNTFRTQAQIEGGGLCQPPAG
ncbi:MAG: VCBS repeat-containing protein [Myxococcales bacterium]|nr:VCBS repeat-containing protein [Myxococcales bacterium]